MCSNKTTSNNLIFHSHHELKGIQWEKEREIIVRRRRTYSNVRPIFGMKHKMHAFRCNNYYPLYKISWYIKIIRPTQWLVPWSVKLRLGIYQVIWYLQKSFVRGVNHVLRRKKPQFICDSLFFKILWFSVGVTWSLFCVNRN